MEGKTKKRRRKKYKLLLNKNDTGNANVIGPSSPNESLLDRVKKETGHK